MLKTKDLAQTIKFYVELLGFVVDSKWPVNNPTDCILDNGQVHLAFSTDPQNWYPDPGLSGQLWIEVDDVLALHASLVGKVSIRMGTRGVQLWASRVRDQGLQRLPLDLQRVRHLKLRHAGRLEDSTSRARVSRSAGAFALPEPE